MLQYLKELFTPPEIHPEVLEAYIFKLPDAIQVAWFRDGKFIIGKVKVGDKEFMTQALSGAEFIEMVNDAVFTVYDIPRHYASLVRSYRAFTPSPEELKKLDDGTIKHSNLSIQKRLVAAGA